MMMNILVLWNINHDVYLVVLAHQTPGIHFQNILLMRRILHTNLKMSIEYTDPNGFRPIQETQTQRIEEPYTNTIMYKEWLEHNMHQTSK